MFSYSFQSSHLSNNIPILLVPFKRCLSTDSSLSSLYHISTFIHLVTFSVSDAILLFTVHLSRVPVVGAHLPPPLFTSDDTLTLFFPKILEFIQVSRPLPRGSLLQSPFWWFRSAAYPCVFPLLLNT